jgi:pyrroloquinoline quinone biosynthesis protein B
VSQNDYLLIDGTFLADGEIARPMSEVPHPFVNETMSLLSELPRAERQKVVFIHFNHSNPLVQGNRQAIQRVTRRGFGIARAGRRFLL